MSIAYRVEDYIAQHHLPWDPVMHRRSSSCAETARFAGVPADRLAKAVVLEDDAGYVMAVIAGNRRLDLAGLNEALHRDLSLAREDELQEMFSDCDIGAVPPVGQAYGVSTVWDEMLGSKADVYFEGGDHSTLVHMSGADFSKLMRSAQRLSLS